MTRLIASFVVALGVAGFSLPAMAQKPAVAGLAEFGGLMHATAQACGDYSAAELEKMKAQQKTETMRQGVSAGDFESNFKKGFNAGVAKLKNMSAADKAKTCEELRAIQQMQPKK